MNSSATVRRMGPKGSDIWHSMLDAAEQILCEDGYGGLTSRSVAERIGVKQRLVYYYFRTMDELIVETFQRLAEREIKRLERAAEADGALTEVWNIYLDTTDTRLVSEFMALANRIEPLRLEVKKFVEQSRDLQVRVLSMAMEGCAEPGERQMPAIAAAIFATSAALAMHREAGIGITSGHQEVKACIADFIARLGDTA